MPIFTIPIAFFALLAIPALAVIYWLRNRARDREVSSLFLWMDERQKWEGGRKMERLRTPLSFFLELLAILLLMLAAAGPMMRATDRGRPLIVVLDDSFSMQAGNPQSAHQKARRAIEGELKNNSYDRVRFVLAGETPQLLGELMPETRTPADLLVNWRCNQSRANMDQAIAFAFEIGGPRARILAVSDHAPAEPPADGRLQWWSFGSSAQNFAFINALRGRQDAKDRVLLEIANLSDRSGQTILTMGSDAPKTILLGARETKQFRLALDANAPALRASLGPDALDVDNQVILFPGPRKEVAIDVSIDDGRIRTLFEHAIESLLDVKIGAPDPNLLLTDQAARAAEEKTAWTLQILKEAPAASFLGPFVLDRSHPLTDGVQLGGVIWGGGQSRNLPGAPVIMAGNIPLLTDLERAGRHELQLRFRPDLSTVQQTPVFPILLANLIEWRRQALPGLRESNLRMGSQASLELPAERKTVTITDPAGARRVANAEENEILIAGELRGAYEISDGEKKYEFAVNALDAAESDLSRAATGQWGNWARSTEFEWEYSNIAWIFLLLALLVLVIHGWALADRAARPIK
jgi:hypothetical protein